MNLKKFLGLEPAIHQSAFPQFTLGDGQISKWTVAILDFKPNPQNDKSTLVTFRFTADTGQQSEITENFHNTDKGHLIAYAQKWIENAEREERRMEYLDDPNAILGDLPLSPSPSAQDIRRQEISNDVRTLRRLQSLVGLGIIESNDSRIKALEGTLKDVLASEDAPLLMSLL